MPNQLPQLALAASYTIGGHEHDLEDLARAICTLPLPPSRRPGPPVGSDDTRRVQLQQTEVRVYARGDGVRLVEVSNSVATRVLLFNPAELAEERAA